jgi:hypothetical protein
MQLSYALSGSWGFQFCRVVVRHLAPPDAIPGFDRPASSSTPCPRRRRGRGRTSGGASVGQIDIGRRLLLPWWARPPR